MHSLHCNGTVLYIGCWDGSIHVFNCSKLFNDVAPFVETVLKQHTGIVRCITTYKRYSSLHAFYQKLVQMQAEVDAELARRREEEEEREERKRKRRERDRRKRGRGVTGASAHRSTSAR